MPLLSFTSGYVVRSLDQFPKQSGKAPWKLRQNYLVDLLNLRLRAIDDGTLVFSTMGSVDSAFPEAIREMAFRYCAKSPRLCHGTADP